MKPEEIKWNDWMRIFVGPVPAEFYIELVIRGFLVYLLLMTSMRLIGKRMSGQVSRLEMAALVSLASAVGIPLLSPSNGFLPAVIIAIIIIGITRLVSYLSVKSPKFEILTQGALDTLIEDGVMHLEIMKKVRVSRERLFAELRSEKIKHLGKVKRVYMEANGAFTVIPEHEAKPGLMVLPDWDKAFVDASVKPVNNLAICKECGASKPPIPISAGKDVTCANCGASDWTRPVAEK